MNKRLAHRPDFNEYNDFNAACMWWEDFVNEFFDDNARLTLRNVIDENGPRNFTIARSLIPRFFRSFIEGGVTDLFFQLSRCQTAIPKDVQAQPQSLLTLETDTCTMNTKHGRPMFAKICTEGHLAVEFLLNNPNHPSFPSNDPHQPHHHHHHHHHVPPLRIRNFIFAIRRHQELIPRSLIAIQQDPQMIDQLSKNITKTGIAPATLQYLKLCSVLEPMQELMVKNRMTGISPRECLRTTVVQKLNTIRLSSSSSDAVNSVGPMGNFQRSNSIGEDMKGEMIGGKLATAATAAAGKILVFIFD